MANIVDNNYTTYELTPEEEQEGSILTISQKQVIQNDISLMAHQILVIDFDAECPAKFNRELHHMRGQMASLIYRIECSKVAEADKLNPPDQ